MSLPISTQKCEPVPLAAFGLAVVLIRTASAARLAEWWAGVVGLPIIRGREPTFYLSLGDCAVLELLADRGAPDEQGVAGSAAPGLHIEIDSLDLTETTRRLQTRGVRADIRSEDGNASITLYDPDGNRVDIRDNPHGSLPEFLPGCAPLPGDLGGIAAIVRSCRDPDRLAQYYGRFLSPAATSAPQSGKRKLEFGNAISLIFRPGGTVRPPARQRGNARTAMIIRVADHDRARDALAGLDLTVVEKDVRLGSAALSYFADPEGQTWAIDERYPPERFRTPRREFAEDHEIRRRLAALHA